MWPQRWLGETYSVLYSRFLIGTFGFSEASVLTSMNEAKLSVCFSKLHRMGALIVFGRTRPRRYRLLDPRSFLLKMSGVISQERVEQEQYIQLIYGAFRAIRARLGITSFCVYGSVARGTAKPLSDVDILLVSDSFSGSLASRVDSLGFVDADVKEEFVFLRENGYRPSLSFYPLRKDEAGRLPTLFLDLTLDSKIVYDEDDFLRKTLSKLKAKLELMGARRIEREGSWYWDLNPEAQPRAIEA